MKNRLAGAVGVTVAVAVAALVGVAPAASAENVAIRPCADLLTGVGSYVPGDTAVSPRMVTTEMELAAAPCDAVTYTLEVTYTTLAGTAVTRTTTAYSATGTHVSFVVQVPEPDAPGEVHGKVTTSRKGRVLDDSEATITFDLVPGSGGGSYQG